MNSLIWQHQYFIAEDGSNRALEERRENELNFYPKEQDMREEWQDEKQKQSHGGKK